MDGELWRRCKEEEEEEVEEEEEEEEGCEAELASLPSASQAAAASPKSAALSARYTANTKRATMRKEHSSIARTCAHGPSCCTRVGGDKIKNIS